MGQARDKRKRFFEAHPYCVFCGGTAAATTLDHVPGRAVFLNRQWPEGYCFPACEGCNQATRLDELIAAMIFRAALEETSEQEIGEFKKYIASVANNHPGLIETMMMTTNEKRKVLRQLNFKPAAGQLVSDLPIARMSDPVMGSIRRFMFKLACALHYLHVKKPLPTDGRVFASFRTNVSNFTDPIDENILRIVPNFVETKRSGKSLEGQFSYRYSISEELGCGAFLCMFYKSYLVTLITMSDSSVVGPNDLAGGNALIVGSFLSEPPHGQSP